MLSDVQHDKCFFYEDGLTHRCGWSTDVAYPLHCLQDASLVTCKLNGKGWYIRNASRVV